MQSIRDHWEDDPNAPWNIPDEPDDPDWLVEIKSAASLPILVEILNRINDELGHHSPYFGWPDKSYARELPHWGPKPEHPPGPSWDDKHVIQWDDNDGWWLEPYGKYRHELDRLDDEGR